MSVKEITIRNYFQEIGVPKVHKELMDGLFADKKYILPKYFYDKRGSELFEEITNLPEYYPTRTEKEILSDLFDIIEIDLNNLNIIELGSGDPSKIILLLKQIPHYILKTINYYPVDICEEEIIKSVEILSQKFNLNSIEGIVADFHHQINMLPDYGCRLFCFFGSTIGNFDMEQAEKFIWQLGHAMNKGDSLLLGLDMVKDINIVECAYNDSAGITAEFNLNILNVINRILDSNFNTNDFEHFAFFSKEKNRIEMHLRANKDLIIEVNNYDPVIIKNGETIHTENSHKFTYSRINGLCDIGNFSEVSVINDKKGWFSIVYAIK